MVKPTTKETAVVELAKKGHESVKRICEPTLRTLFVRLPRDWETGTVSVSVSVSVHPGGLLVRPIEFDYAPRLITKDVAGSKHFDSIVILRTGRINLRDWAHSRVSDLILSETRESRFFQFPSEDHRSRFDDFIKNWFRLECTRPHNVIASDIAVAVSSVASHNLGLTKGLVRPDKRALDDAYESLVRKYAKQPVPDQAPESPLQKGPKKPRSSDGNSSADFLERKPGKIPERDFETALFDAKQSFDLKYLHPTAEITAERLGDNAPLAKLRAFKVYFETPQAAVSTFEITRLAAEYRGECKLQSYIKTKLRWEALSLTEAHRHNCKNCGSIFRRAKFEMAGDDWVIRYGPNLSKNGPVVLGDLLPTRRGGNERRVIKNCPECHNPRKPIVPQRPGPKEGWKDPNPGSGEGHEPDTRAAWDFVDSLLEHIQELLEKQRVYGATRSPPDKRLLNVLIRDGDRLFRSGFPKILEHLQDVQGALQAEKRSKSAVKVAFLAALPQKIVLLGPLPRVKCPVPISVRLGEKCLDFIETCGEAAFRDAVRVLLGYNMQHDRR